MGFRPSIRPERDLQPKREVKRHNPFTEKDAFFKEHSSLLVDLSEVNYLLSLDDTEETQQELELLSKNIAQQVDKEYEKDPKQAVAAKNYLIGELVDRFATDDDSALEEKEVLLNKFTKAITVGIGQKEFFLQRLKKGEEAIQSAEEVLERLPHIQSDLDEIITSIKPDVESIENKTNPDHYENPLMDLINEIATLGLEESVAKALFSKIAKQVAATWEHDPLVVDSLSKDHLLLRRLKFGTNGETYKALNALGEIVAVKILTPRNPVTKKREASASRADARQFQRELFVLQEVEGEHLVGYEGGEIIQNGQDDEGRPLYTGWTALEYLDGGDVKDYLQEKEQLMPKEAISLGLQIAKGLKPLHDAGIIHRDIKPDNVMVEQKEDGPHYKIIDFGITLRPDNPFEVDKGEDDSQALYGTPMYMAPETAVQAIPKSDIFALGIMLFEALSGSNEHPFISKEEKKQFAKQPVAIVFAISTKMPLHLSDVNASIPKEISHYIDRMLSPSPEDRPDIDHVIRFFSHMNQQFNLENAMNDLSSRLTKTQSIPAYGRSNPVENLPGFGTIKYERPLPEIIETASEFALSAFQGKTFSLQELQSSIEESLQVKLLPEEFNRAVNRLKEKGVISKKLLRDQYTVINK